MEQEDLDSWEHFESRYQEIQAKRQEAREHGWGGVSDFLFRGQGNVSWPLATTLDRTGSEPWSFTKYYRLISIAKPQIETFTGRRWDLPEHTEFQDWAANYDSFIHKTFPAYEYLIYLRHHGFPSPLLDWTRSPYVAAYFAFASAGVERVAIFIYLEYAGHGKFGSSDAPRVVSLGRYVRSHPRHFLQQSEYTIGTKYERYQNESSGNGDWWYAPHESVFSPGDTTQDRLWKLTIPVSERVKVLRNLEAYNLNAFSLFQTDETLLETIAIREIELSERGL